MSDPNYWPDLIQQSSQAWPELPKQARIAEFFDLDSMSFKVALPREHGDLVAFLSSPSINE